jgi:colicin import membrane protein
MAARERSSDRWVSIVQSVLLHGLVIGALAWGWWSYKNKPKPVQANLAIEAVVMDAAPRAGKPIPEETPPPPPPEPEPEPEPEPPPQDSGPPSPTPEEIAAKEQAVREEAERVETARKLEEQRVAEQRQAEEREAAEKKAREEAEAKRRDEERRAEAKRLAEAKKRAEEKRRQDEENRLREQRESELRRSLEEEERVMAARSSGAMSSWIGQIQARVQRAWLRPPTARAGIECLVYVTQVPGGEVTNVRVGTCNGDQAVRDSIEAAVYRASPLPPPPDPALFERNLELTFKPTD